MTLKPGCGSHFLSVRLEFSMDLVVFEEGGGFNRPEVEKTCSLKSTKSFDYVT